jgi:hypothetical protein
MKKEDGAVLPIRAGAAQIAAVGDEGAEGRLHAGRFRIVGDVVIDHADAVDEDAAGTLSLLHARSHASETTGTIERKRIGGRYQGSHVSSFRLGQTGMLKEPFSVPAPFASVTSKVPAMTVDDALVMVTVPDSEA